MNKIKLDFDKCVIITPAEVFRLLRLGKGVIFINGEQLDVKVENE